MGPSTPGTFICWGGGGGGALVPQCGGQAVAVKGVCAGVKMERGGRRKGETLPSLAMFGASVQMLSFQPPPERASLLLSLNRPEFSVSGRQSFSAKKPDGK